MLCSLSAVAKSTSMNSEVVVSSVAGLVEDELPPPPQAERNKIERRIDNLTA